MTAPKKARTSKAKTSKSGGWQKVRATPLELPSGETALVKRPGIQAFLTTGKIPDLLAPIIQEQIDKAQGKPTKGEPEKELDVAALMADPQKLAAVLEMVDTVLVEVVVEPKVAAAPENPEDRQDDVFYPDEVDLEDKMFIFNYAVGGSRSLERFREATAGGVAGVDAVAGVQLAP